MAALSVAAVMRVVVPYLGGGEVRWVHQLLERVGPVEGLQIVVKVVEGVCGRSAPVE